MTTLELTLTVLLVLMTAAAAALLVTLRWTALARRVAVASRASAVEAQHQVAELAAGAERLRILREMHDVIAHSLAIMIAQADGGSYVTADPAASQRTFVTIAETGRTALADTRRILGILKHGDAGDPELTPSSVPDLADLVEGSRATGLEIAVVGVGAPQHLPSAAAMAVYRICQEALTNVHKHAGPAAQVVITQNWGENALVLTVTNSAAESGAAPASGLGLGLVGMRERAELVSGRLEAHPTAEGGFRVSATIPYRLPEDADA